MPYTRLHQLFLIYMVVISCLRLAVVAYQFADNNGTGGYETFLFCLAICLAIVSILMLAYWVCNKKNMPMFDDFSKVDINTITERIANPLLGYDHGSMYP